VSEFEVAIGAGPVRRFRDPHAVARTLDAADDALRQGYWIAGTVAYEGAVAIGIFDPPQSEALASDGRYAFGAVRADVSSDEYRRAIDEIADAIYEGDVYQVNYTMPFDFRFDGDPYALYAGLAAKSGAAYCGYVRDGDEHVVSFSPELFLRFESGRLATKPMKGTAALDRIDDLRTDKNRAEHVMIVDLLRNDLHRICADVRVERLFEVERYPTFATMTSTISGALDRDVRLADVFRAAFPCGSVTGAPKRAAMACIARTERRPRGAYCGTLGFLAPERRGWWNVAIRTAQIDTARRAGRFDAGGGIVADSDAASERDEIALKARFFLEGAVPVEPIETFAGGDPATRDAHLTRMRSTAATLGIAFDGLRVRDAVSVSDRAGALLRVRLTAAGDAIVEPRPLAAPAEPVAVLLSSARVRSDDPLLRLKTTWRPAQERAAAEADAAGCFDALLRNERGELTEGARTTLFARIDGTLVTPPLEAGLLPGILRARMLAAGEAVERTIAPDDLRRAEAIFVGNSARGMLRAHLVETGAG